jgi:NAD(P)-dependent dehydrogenase (short-subunit alcohol dehydrogenase family)
MPLLQGSPARVVALTSFGHNFAKELPMDDLNWERRTYGAWPAYGQAKLSNALFARELARRWVPGSACWPSGALRLSAAASKSPVHWTLVPGEQLSG